MKDIDNIEDWYREELNNYNVEPDQNLWNSLSEDLDASTPLTDENFSEWYKKEVTKLEERPDYTVWEKLSTKLDTATVWEKLTVSLNRYDQIIWWRNFAFKGTAIFLLFLGSYLAYNNYTTNSDENNVLANNDEVINQKNTVHLNSFNEALPIKKNKKSLSKENVKSLVSQKNTETNNKPNLKNNSSLNEYLTTEEKVEKAVNTAKENVKPKPTYRGGRSKESTAYASLNKIQKHYSSIYKDRLDELKSDEEKDINRDIDRHTLTERDISHLYSSDDFLVKKDKNKIVFNSKRFSAYSMFGVYARRVYAGFNVGIKKQGMITKIKNDSPLATYKQNDYLDFGTNLGGTVGFIVSDNFNLEANINFNSTSGYKRAFNAEGISYLENLNLNYTSISILGKKMNNKSTFDNKVFSTNLIGGVYIGYLWSQVSDANGVTRNLNDFNKTDFGLTLGIEQDRYLSKTIVITPGIRYNQGITNNVNDNSPFESSRNFSFEFNLGVKYIFLKKGK